MGAVQGRAEAFEQLVAPYERQVYFTCLRIMGNRQDAEDAAQESLLKAFRAFDGFRGEAKVSTWLYTIATRCCLDILRGHRKIISLETLQEEGWEAPSEVPSPYLQMETAERKRLLEAALTLLPDDQRAAIVLCDLQGLSYEEAAQALEAPLGTIKSRINRGRLSLKRHLSASGELFTAEDSLNDERRETK